MNPVFAKYVTKRSSCLNSISESAAQTVRFESIKKLMESKNNVRVKQLGEKYISGLMTTKEATKNYDKALSILGYLDENKIDYTSTYQMFKEMMFYIDTNELSTFDEWVNSINYINNKKYDIHESIAYIALADRIINNNKVLNNKFDFENKIKALRYRDIKDVIKEAVSILGEYTTMKEYQKMNVVMEQLIYISTKDNFKFNGNIPSSVMEYFILNSDEKRDNIYRVLEESPLVTQEDLDIINNKIANANDQNNVKTSINRLIDYLAVGKANGESINSLLFETLTNTTVEDIIANIDSLILFLTNNYNVFDDPCLAKIFIKALDQKELSIDQINNIIFKLNNLEEKFLNFTNCVKNICIIRLSLEDRLNFSQSKENIDAIMAVSSESADVVSLEEFKKFKFNGLLSAVHKLDKFLQGKEKIFLQKAKKKLAPVGKKLTELLFGESSYIRENIYSFIGSDNKVDICVRQYALDEEYFENNNKNILRFLDNCIKEFNSQLDISRLSNIKSYYIISENVAEIHIKDATILDLSEQDHIHIAEADDPAMDIYINMIDEAYNTLNQYKDLPIIDINNLVSYKVVSKCSKMALESFEAALEAMKYLQVSKDQVESFINAYNDIAFNESSEEIKSNKILENWNHYEGEIPLEVSLEAYEILYTIISETISNPELLTEDSSVVYDHMKQNGYDWDEDEDDSDDEDEDEGSKNKKPQKKETKKPAEKPSKMYGNGEDLPKGDEKKKTSFNLNSAILAAKGLAGKAKHYSGKIKEKIDNLDHSMRSFIEAIKKADSDSRREQIIKGSVIPSFSKCINAGLALIVLGVATGGVVAPIIAAIAGFAMDKKLTQKEKLLILDEIDTELEVIDKELAMADQNNQTNKYRALLRYKKDLQRQYQRIRYNIRIGQDTAMFSSNVGMQKKD